MNVYIYFYRYIHIYVCMCMYMYVYISIYTFAHTHPLFSKASHRSIDHKTPKFPSNFLLYSYICIYIN